MPNSARIKNLRILVVDDNRAIHADFRKILCAPVETPDDAWESAQRILLGEQSAARTLSFEMDSAYQGAEALELVRKATLEGRPYAMAFLDIRMPPGWDGVETAGKLWEVAPDLQVVICTAYSDYAWEDMVGKLGCSDRLLLLKKPFDAVEVLQFTSALTEKWTLQQQARIKLDELENLVQERTRTLLETNRNLQEEIMERQRSAESLRVSEERYQLLFSKNPLPMWVFDMETLKFLAVNETAVREYGYSVTEFLSMTIKDIRPEREVSLLMQKLGENRHSAAHSYNTRLRKKCGREIDVEVIWRPSLFAGRRACLVLAADITERKAAQDRIREQAALLELAHDAIYVQDLSGAIQFWNKGAEKLFGWTSAEVIGRNISEFFNLDTTGCTRAAEKALLQNGEWSGELRRHDRNKEEIVVASRWTLVRDEQGKPSSILCINGDVTEKKKLEAQFLRSQRMEGIGTLATGMAHDLNNVLAPILMSAGSLRWDLTSEEYEQAVSRIEVSVKRGADIIQQVLTFGRGVSGDRVAVNPGELITEVIKIADQTFPKDIIIRKDMEPGLWPIIGDKTQIHQILLNLCINSRDAMPKGGHLLLEAENVIVDAEFAANHAPLQAGPFVCLSVSDSGEGIPAANLEKIFDPFFTTKELGKGTGLGLSTVLGIVKSHHGLVTVDSVPGQGAEFKIYLPASPSVVKRSTPGESAELPRGNGETILLVDDEASLVAATKKMLEQYGYQVRVAGNGREALAIFTRDTNAIRLVATDIMMPRMDGMDLIRFIRRMSSEVRIVAFSGLGKDLAGRTRADELKAQGVSAFLSKPYTAEKLLTALHDALNEEHPDTESVSAAA